MDVCLTNYGHCNYVSGKHACIFYDEVRGEDGVRRSSPTLRLLLGTGFLLSNSRVRGRQLWVFCFSSLPVIWEEKCVGVKGHSTMIPCSLEQSCHFYSRERDQHRRKLSPLGAALSSIFSCASDSNRSQCRGGRVKEQWESRGGGSRKEGFLDPQWGGIGEEKELPR